MSGELGRHSEFPNDGVCNISRSRSFPWCICRRRELVRRSRLGALQVRNSAIADYVIAHIDEPIEVSTLEDSGAQPVPFYPVAHPIRWRQSAPLRRAFAMATSGRACSSCPIRLGRCRGAHRLCRPKPSHALGPARSRRFPDGTGRLSPKSRNLQDQRLPLF